MNGFHHYWTTSNVSVCAKHNPIVRRGPRLQRAKSPKDGDQFSSPDINEDLLDRLKCAEAEASRLKEELAAVRSTQDSEASVVVQQRIDGGDLRRETLSIVPSKQRNWLSEEDVQFWTGGAPGESGDVVATSEEKATVSKRLAIGLGITVAAIAFAIIPTPSLAPKPTKPIFFYLAPLLQAEIYLSTLEVVIPKGDYGELRALLSKLEGEPCNIQDNLRSAARLASKPQIAEFLARDVYELVRQVDYNQYYESVGKQNDQRHYEFSLSSAKAAQVKLKEFLTLMPPDQVEAAMEVLKSSSFP